MIESKEKKVIQTNREKGEGIKGRKLWKENKKEVDKKNESV